MGPVLDEGMAVNLPDQQLVTLPNCELGHPERELAPERKGLQVYSKAQAALPGPKKPPTMAPTE